MSVAGKLFRSRFATGIAASWLCIVGLFTFAYPVSNRYTGRVVSISESAQVVVLKDGRPESLRLAEVEFPQKGQPNARAARAFANRLALGQDVRVEESRLQGGGRIGYVTLSSGRNLSAELVKAGLAWPSSQGGRLAPSLAALELNAMSARRGIWGEAREKPKVLATHAARPPLTAGETASFRSDEPQGGDGDDAEAADDTTSVETGAATLSEN